MSEFDNSSNLRRDEQIRSSSSARRSRSVSRDSETIPETRYQDNNNYQTQKFQIDRGTNNQRGNWKQNSISKTKKKTNKKKNQEDAKYWDKDGFLLDTHQNEPSHESNKQNDMKKSYLTPRSIAIIVSSRPALNRSIMETAEQSPKSPKAAEPIQTKSQRKRAPSVQESRDKFNEFIKRQKKSAEKHISTENSESNNQEEKFLSKESRLILKRANKQNSSILADSQRRKKKPPQQEEEFSFHPDLSLTLHSKKVSGLSLQFSEAKEVIKDIQLTAIKVEQEAIDMKECTYKPDLISNPKARAKANREKINQRKREKNKELEKLAYKGDKIEECKQVKFCKKIPSRTQELNDMLKVFKKAGRENDDDDES